MKRLREASRSDERTEAKKRGVHPCEDGDPHCALCNEADAECCSPNLIRTACPTCGGSGTRTVERGRQ